ncbi:hypothetical protein ACFYPT_36010 [Streptomyces sp. NPDC005529]
MTDVQTVCRRCLYAEASAYTGFPQMTAVDSWWWNSPRAPFSRP